MFRRLPFQKVVVAAEVIVMPRSCSCSIQSMVAGAVVHFADLMRFAGIIENPLRRRRLAASIWGHDAEVTVILDSVSARHE